MDFFPEEQRNLLHPVGRLDIDTEGLLLLTKSPSIAVIPAILLGACVYFILLLVFRGVTEQELRGFPKGHLLVKAAKKCRLMK